MRRSFSAGSGRYSRFFFHRRVLHPAGFRRTPPWCRGVISNDHSVQRRRFGEKPGPERTEAQTPMKEDDGRTNPHRRGRCPRNGRMLRNNGISERIPGVVRHPENASFGIFYRQPIWELLHRGLRRIRSPPVSVHFHRLRLSPRCRGSHMGCRWVSIRRAPSAPAAAPAAESLHASPAVAHVTGWNNQLQRVLPAGPPAAPHRHRVRVLIG